MALVESPALRTEGGTPPPVRRSFQSVRWAVRKYTRIYRVSLIERLAYRADFLLGTFLRFLPMITTILLWQAVYASSPDKQLAGYSLHEMIAYLLLVHISRMFSSMPGLSTGIARDIRQGEIKKYLIQPLDMIGYLAVYRMAHKTAYILMSALPYAVLFFVCRSYFDRMPEAATLLAYCVSLVLAWAVGFFFETCLGMIGFWFLEVTSLLYIVNTLNYFISGQMFPLELLGWAGQMLKLLPFQYLAYFPAAVFLGKISGPALVQGLLIQLAWALGLAVLSRVLFKFGLRRYGAYGG
jgi:ABC-2 type transport system permease protein